MRITEQQVRVGVDYQQQQIQLRQQTTLNSQLPVRDIRLSQQSSDYQELEISSLTEGIARQAQPEAEIQQKLDDSSRLNRRELAKKAREAAESSASAKSSTAETTSSSPLVPNLELIRQTSEWLESLDKGFIPGDSQIQPDEDFDTDMSLSSQMRILKTLLEKMLDITIDLPQITGGQGADAPSNAPTGQPAAAAPPTPLMANGEPNRTVQLSEASYEQEQLAFVANGQVSTADGREIKFDLGFALNYQKLQLSERLTSSAALKDPLVLNLEGLVPGFSSARFEFDLDADGSRESLTQLANNSAFLALDRNGNGQIDDGSELFGARSGNGFAELAALDEDGNGILDEADSGFASLRLYRSDTTLLTLGDQKIGAIFLNAAATPFMHLGGDQGAQGESPAVLRQTGIYLTEDGKAGTLQQIDLRV
ncbi:MAG: hypothetical protein QMB40_01895 [Aeromonadaceae bacterium]